MPAPGAALELSEPLEYGGGSPVTGADDFKDEEPKENTVGAPTTEGKEKVAAGAAGSAGGTETGAGAAEASSLCGACEVGVVGVLPAATTVAEEEVNANSTGPQQKAREMGLQLNKARRSGPPSRRQEKKRKWR